MNKSITASLIVGVTFGMLGLSFAAKPLYDTFCKVTGFGGTTRDATEAPDRVLEREVTVRFDANINGLPFRFRALEPNLVTKVGETNLAFYEVTNTGDRPYAAIASYNVTPHKAGPYFTKLECFCYDEQVFQPGETKTLPVVFFINPLIDEDDLLNDVKTITLSYTYFQAKDDKDKLASLPDLVSDTSQ